MAERGDGPSSGRRTLKYGLNRRYHNTHWCLQGPAARWEVCSAAGSLGRWAMRVWLGQPAAARGSAFSQRWIELAARLPSPMARITVAAPRTMSPPANTPGMLVIPDSSVVI